MGKPVSNGRYADIAERLRMVREHFDLSAKEFAIRAGIDPSRYYKWEDTHNRIPVDAAQSLKREYGLTLDFIYDGSLDMLPHKMVVAFKSSPSHSE